MLPFTKNKTNSNTSVMSGLLRGVVKISISAVDATIAGGGLAQSAKNLSDLTHTSASATEELASTSETISQSAMKAHENVGEALGSVTQAVDIIGRISSDMSAAEESIRSLEKASIEIEGIVSALDGISDQTNLLALNAAIEAARAGDAGRGFAVVADEVKKLSQRSQDSTQEIVGMIHQIQEDIKKAVKAVTSSAGRVEEGTITISSVKDVVLVAQSLVNEIAAATQEQTIATGQISESIQDVVNESKIITNIEETLMDTVSKILMEVEIERATLAAQDIPNKILHLAKTDHLLWKKKLFDYHAGRIELTEADLGDHTVCRLGKWYYANGQQEFGKSAAFQEMEEAHKEVHAIARDAYERRQADRNAPLNDLIEKVTVASNTVVACLDALINNVED